MKKTDNLHITGVTPLITPNELKREIPVNEASNQLVASSRETIIDIIEKRDRRLLAIIGPCSIHDPEAAIEYAGRLARLAEIVADKFFVVMRTYFEKPRTVLGWKGLITDPHLGGSYDIEAGLRIARKLLLDITGMGIPCGSEMLDPIVPQYIADVISWASIGARTSESQTHREMASGLSMPVGFKNSTSGDLKTAVNAMKSARHSHGFIGIDQDGKSSIFMTAGNPATHIILRGGSGGPNYYEEHVEEAEKAISALGIEPALIIDCSHANSGKDCKRQSRVLHAITDQRNRGKLSIAGFMIESNIVGGAQSIPEDKSSLMFGQSITDECVSWEETEEMIMNAYHSLRI
jgi:3-deoxy-7-phosphoheptulonate synthase